MAKVNRPPDVFAEIRELEKRIRVLENANRATNTSIKGGTLSILDDQGRLVASIGDHKFSDGSTHTGLVVVSPDAVDKGALVAGWDPTPGSFQATVFDAAGNPVFATNANVPGIGHPYLTAAMYPVTQTMVPNTSWTTLFAARLHMHAAAIKADFYGVADSASTGAARLLVDGVQIGSTVTLPTNTATEYTIGPAVVSGWTFDSEVYVELQVQRTAGTGNVGLSPLLLLNREP
jgi:hypothetical protein